MRVPTRLSAVPLTWGIFGLGVLVGIPIGMLGILTMQAIPFQLFVLVLAFVVVWRFRPRKVRI